MALEKPPMQGLKGNMHPPRGEVSLQRLQVLEQGLKQIPVALP